MLWYLDLILLLFKPYTKIVNYGGDGHSAQQNSPINPAY